MSVTNLFIKARHGGELRAVASLRFDRNGIDGNVRCSPLRQVLVASQSVMRDCGLNAGDLRENVVVDFGGLYDLPSGTVVQIGDALIRLTFHCEPCKTVLRRVALELILHRRGVLGSFLNAETMSVGDGFVVTEQRCEPIPYALKDRIRWLLDKEGASTVATDLVHQLGLPSSYAGAIGRVAQKLAASRHSGP